MFFAIKTTASQETNVAMFIEAKAKMRNVNIQSILVVPELKGYVIVEANEPYKLQRLIREIRHVRSLIPVAMEKDEVLALIKRKEEFHVGDTVEIIAGPLKGHRGLIRAIKRNRATVELTDVTSLLTITLKLSQLKSVR